jgi:hypothetical protein
MELKLENLCTDLAFLTDIHNQNQNPISVRVTNRSTGKAVVFYCAYSAPKFVVLPKNVIWIDMNPESEKFMIAFKRTTYDQTNPDNDVWSELYFYDDAMADQSYDSSDMQYISLDPPPRATKSIHGVGMLSAADPTATVVVESDARLSDTRDPVSHTHDEVPATHIGYVDSHGALVEAYPIADQNTPALNQTLRFDGTQYVWGKIKEADLTGV